MTAVESGAEVVFVCGGDGTVMSAVSALVGTDTAMAILPAGTGNLLAANLGLSTDLAAGLEVALESGLRRLDVGAVEGQYFAVMAGMGFDAHMLDATSETAKAHIGWAAYVLGALKSPQGPADAGDASASTTASRCAVGPGPCSSPTWAVCRAAYDC